MAKKKKARAPKKESKKKADEDELEEDFLGEEEPDAAELGADEVDIEDDEDLPEEEEIDEEEAKAPAKKAKAEAEEPAEGETLQSKLRKKDAERKSRKPPVIKKTWYEFKRGTTYNPKKGLKLVRMQLTKNGATSEYMGWEKKIPKSFLKKIRAAGELKE